MEQGRACAEYSQRIIQHYLLTVNRHHEVLDPKLELGPGGTGRKVLLEQSDTCSFGFPNSQVKFHNDILLTRNPNSGQRMRNAPGRKTARNADIRLMGSGDRMTQDVWTAVDKYITDLLVPSDPALEAALQASSAAGLPSIQVSPVQGKFLHLLARACGARARCWRSARWAATAPFGLPGRCVCRLTHRSAWR